MKLKIEWNKNFVKANIKSVEEFVNLARTDYKKYYKGVKTADIKKEYEYLTDKSPIINN